MKSASFLPALSIMALVRWHCVVNSHRLFLFLGSIAAAAVGFVRLAFLHNSSLSSMDLLVNAADPTRGLPLVWLVCPLIAMVYLGVLWTEKDLAVLVIRSRGRLPFAASMVVDVALISVLASFVIVLILLLSGLLFGLGVCDFDSETSLFARSTAGATLANVAVFPMISIVCAYIFTAQFILGMMFCFFRMVFGAKPSFAIIVLLCLPAIHAHDSFVYDIMHNISGGTVIIPNPISYIFEYASISYASWLDSSHYILWLLCVAVCVSLLALVASLRKEY